MKIFLVSAIVANLLNQLASKFHCAANQKPGALFLFTTVCEEAMTSCSHSGSIRGMEAFLQEIRHELGRRLRNAKSMFNYWPQAGGDNHAQMIEQMWNYFLLTILCEYLLLQGTDPVQGQNQREWQITVPAKLWDAMTTEAGDWESLICLVFGSEFVAIREVTMLERVVADLGGDAVAFAGPSVRQLDELLS